MTPDKIATIRGYAKRLRLSALTIHAQDILLKAQYESTSFIITTNKSPAEWGRSLDDEVPATALLDRLFYKCELLQLSGYDNSYVM